MSIDSSVVHQLYVSLRSQSCRPSNRAVTHDSDLLLRVDILNGYRRCDWVKVTCHIFCSVLDIFLSFPESLVLHVQPIEVNPKIVVGIESIEKLPVDDQVLTFILWSHR